MDEVIQCICERYDLWVIGTNGIRCSGCHYCLPDLFVVDVSVANVYIAGYIAGKHAHKEESRGNDHEIEKQINDGS